jgi:uncharacterized protein
MYLWRVRKKKNFWEYKKLDEMTHIEWELLCDHCGMCCLHKIKDEEMGEIHYTCVACRFLDITHCKCRNYPTRQEVQPDCITLTPGTVKDYPWLPASCAYRLLAEGNPLPPWHHLLTNQPDSIHKAQRSAAHFAVPECDVNYLEDYLIIEF